MSKVEITCREDIIKLPDIASLRALKKQWKVETDGRPLRDREDYVRLLLEVYDSGISPKGGGPPPPDPNAGLAEAIQLDTQNRARLQEFYDDVLKYYGSLTPQFQKSLNTAYPDLVNRIAGRRKELDSRELVILVAGDTGAGKSSFINLLLETDILPVAAIAATQTICEMRKSKNGEKVAMCFFKTEDPKKRRPPDIIKIDNPAGLEELKERIKYRDDEDDSPFERIEIYMPFRMLEEGVVIVDSPGFGEHGRKSGQVERYLAKSFGTIYLVNTAAAGGVNAGRLRDFLRFVVNSAGEDHDPSATIFIGNKIDCVDPRDLQEVKNTTTYKLKQCYPGLKDSNVFFMSVNEASQMVKLKSRSADHQEVLVQGIQKLFPASLRNKLNSHYRFQSQILKRTLVSLKVARTMALTGRERQQNEIEDIQRRMRVLEQNAKATIKNLKTDIRYEEDHLYEDLASSLRSRSFTEKVFDIQEKQCAKPSRDWKAVAQDANEIIGNIIAQEVDKWEAENNCELGIKARILDKFTKECQVYENQLKEIESALLDGDVRVIKDLHKSMKKQAPVRQIWARAKDTKSGGGGGGDKLNSLGALVSSAGGLSTSNKRVKDHCRGYSAKNQLQGMKSLISIFIENIFDGNDLRVKISKFVGRFAKGVDTIAKKIPDFVEADKELIKNIQEDIKNAEYNLREVFPKCLGGGTRLQGQLDVFYVKKIMEMDYRLRDLEYNPTEDLLGSGAFANVYRGKLVCYRPPIQVALKIGKDYLQENNVSDVLLEDGTMRELDHKNIVKYYGATLREEKIKGKGRLFWIMILEFCSGTLKDKIINDDYDNPAKVGKIYSVQVEQMEEMARMVIEICEGLRYLHNKDLVHRDLKLENILLAKGSDGKDVIKLTDVGLTKPQREIGGSIVGSPAYMAPEVLLQTEIHNRKADIFSLAIILWEMWYGIDAAEHIQSQLFGTLESAVKGGLRPSMTIEHKPPADWMALIKRCWDYDPKNRPEVDEVLNHFANFLKH
ncbi:uncharacterized protein LOC133195895 [Saccostrea echinata]|uniref:uncharacterized protein LOC133195895 n=1 Tax=Saccostrea echinata TaxID=191078 RepID=UPI002A80066A|nr:uncharacterized protein LOC133195895 [Saccostrea echinata]